MTIKNILLIEPFYTGSHKKWADTYQKYSAHSITILSLPGKYWKWRMHGAAVELASQFLALNESFDLVLATDMLDLSTFISLAREKLFGIPVFLYFHENQLTYPWSATDQDVELKRDNHYAFINFTSALSADKVFFNSHYHKNSFVEALPEFLNQFPDYKLKERIQEIKSKSEVLPLLMDLGKFDLNNGPPKHMSLFRVTTSISGGSGEFYQKNNPCIILWNHRWEYDKNPESFFQLMYQLKEEKFDFRLIVVGKNFAQFPPIFKQAKEKLKDHILHWGYVSTQEEYAALLNQSDILPVTSNQDFFGGSVVEAIYCNVMPLLPNRLAYPEHIPSELHNQYLYEDYQELFDKIKNAIINIDKVRKVKYREFVKKYTAESLIKRYNNI